MDYNQENNINHTKDIGMLPILNVIVFLDKWLSFEESVSTAIEDDCWESKGCSDAAVWSEGSLVNDKLAFSFEDCLFFYIKKIMK